MCPHLSAVYATSPNYTQTPSVSSAKAEIVTEVLYDLAMITVELSIFLLYHRYFSSQKFKIVLWTVAASTLCYTIAGTLIVIFQCLPIRSDWDSSIKPHCVNLNPELIAIGVLNSNTVVFILSLPIPFLWRLQSSAIHKIQLAVMFSPRRMVCIKHFLTVPNGDERSTNHHPLTTASRSKDPQ